MPEPLNSQVTILDPTVQPKPIDGNLASRPDTLTGKVLGLLDNHKMNASGLLDNIERLLSQRYEFAKVVRRTKKDVSRPCPTEIIKEMVAECDVVVTAIGD